MRCVIVESPYAGDVPAERAAGIAAGLAIGARMDATVVYCDLGVSSGMKLGISAAQQARRPVEYRWIRPHKTGEAP